MKKILFLLFFLNSFFNLFSEKLLDKEIIVNSENSKSKIEKQFVYDVNNNIIEIRDFNNGKITAKYVYSYKANILESVEEYINGVTKISKSIFEYNDKNVIIKKSDYDKNDVLIMYHEYLFLNDNITEIKDYLPDQKYLGEKVFFYLNDRLSEEYIVDTNDNKIIIKKYLYKDNLIDSIDYYSSNREKIRTIKMKYLNKKAETSKFGLRNNFYDFR